MLPRTISLSSMICLFAFTLIACGEASDDDEPLQDGDCGAFCVDEVDETAGSENMDANISQQNAIEEICTDICAHEAECQGMSADDESECADLCVDDLTSQNLDASPGCMDALLSATDCWISFSCEQPEQAEAHCSDEMDDTVQYCDFDNGSEPVEPVEPEPEPAMEEQIFQVCNDLCAQFEACDGFPASECNDECTEGALDSYHTEESNCFEAEMDAARCASSLSCSEFDDIEQLCEDEVESVEDYCPVAFGTGVPD